MELILEFLRNNIFLIIMFIFIVILFILYISTIIKLNKLRNSYSIFMKKIGNGDNIDEMLKIYIKDVDDVKSKNEDIIKYCQSLNTNIEECVQKIGLVRYNAFKDTGSDLSFALAILDKQNNGIVLNGIYARESSNIYAKLIEKGESKYILSEEEKEAIKRAIEKNI